MADQYKMTFNYLLTHREIPMQYFGALDDFYEKILPDPQMMQKFLLFSYNRAKYFAMENPDIEPAFEIDEFKMFMYGKDNKNILIINMPQIKTPPESFQIAIPASREKAGYYTCELSYDPIKNEPCIVLGEWNAEKKHTNHGIINVTNENSFAEVLYGIVYGK